RGPPAGVGLYERPVLRRPACLRRIFANVLDNTNDVFRRIQEHLPARAAPDWMGRRALAGINKVLTTGLLKRLDHCFRAVAVAADQEMNVIRHDSACVACVAAL